VYWRINEVVIKKSRCGRDFPPVQIGPGAHPASCKMGTASFLGVKCGRGVLLATHSLLVPQSWKSRAIPLPTLWATSVTGSLYLYLFINSSIKCGYFGDNHHKILYDAM